MYRQAATVAPAAPIPAPRGPRPAPVPVSEAAPARSAAGGAELRADGLARALAASVIQRSAAGRRGTAAGVPVTRMADSPGGPAVVQRKTTAASAVQAAAKTRLKTSIGGTSVSECKKRLAKRFPKGPLFTDADLADIQTMQTWKDGRKWLSEVGIGSWNDAVGYLAAADYRQWLKQPAGKRLLLATMAWRNGTGATDANPPPSYTLGRAMAIQTGANTGPLDPAAKARAEAERDRHIRDAFVNTLMPVGPAELATVGQAWTDTAATIAANLQAQDILARILLILQAGLQVYDPAQGAHVDFKTADVVRALAHGGRVNIRIPALSGLNATDDAYALTDWIGITHHGAAAGAVTARGFGTHHMAIGKNKQGPGTGSFVEEGGKGASLANKRSKGVKLFGLDLAAGGLGRRDFNGDVILPDGAHGHMFIGFTKPTATTDGALQIGIETTAPGAPSLVGYKHDWNSTEATANPESSLYGHKMQKVGGGSLATNQRLVDLNTMQARAGQLWLDVLTASHDQLLADLALAAGQERGVYELLAGRRT